VPPAAVAWIITQIEATGYIMKYNDKKIFILNEKGT
jgi:hypothetical protein